jgi:hypothetical protein
MNPLQRAAHCQEIPFSTSRLAGEIGDTPSLTSSQINILGRDKYNKSIISINGARWRSEIQ